MTISTHQKNQKFLGELERDTNVQNVNDAKYLGLHIDRPLTLKSM